MYTEMNPGEKKETLVFLHGNSSSSRVFEHFVANHKRFSTCCIDLPGHGKSDKGDTASYGIRNMREALVETIQSRVDVPFMLVGNSIGGHLAIEIAEALDHCKAITIFGVSPFKVPLNIEEALKPNPALQSYFKDEVSEEELEATLDEISKVPAIRKILKADFLHTDPNFRSTLAVSVMANHELKDEFQIISNLKIPTYLLLGENDPTVPLSYLQTVPNVTKLIELQDCGHYPSLEQPEAFQKILEEVAGEVF